MNNIKYIKNPITNGKIEDLTGVLFGKLTVLKLDIDKLLELKDNNKRIDTYWICQCNCISKTIISVRGSHLKSGNTKSCACKKNELYNSIGTDNLIGMKFNHWLVLKEDDKKSNHYICECDCEKHNVKSIRYDHLILGNSKSCGCYQIKSANRLSSERRQDIIGKKFGRLTVISLDKERSKGRNAYYFCKCDCDNPKMISVYRNSLQRETTKSCGCLASELTSIRKMNDLTGQKFGKLTVLRMAEHKVGDGRLYFWCKCDCENEELILVEGRRLTSGITKSCGCLGSSGEQNIKTFLNNNYIKFIPQQKYETLLGLGGNKLSYDFYLPSYNLLVEYQGKQHYESIEYFGGDEQFEIQVEHDSRKRNYARLHNIDLLEIPYWEEKNLENILNDKLRIKGEFVI